MPRQDLLSVTRLADRKPGDAIDTRREGAAERRGYMLRDNDAGLEINGKPRQHGFEGLGPAGRRPDTNDALGTTEMPASRGQFDDRIGRQLL